MDVQHENGVLMTKIILAILLAFSINAFCNQNEVKPQAKAETKSELKNHQYQMNIDGMVCNYCVESIRLRMKKNKEVQDVKIDMNKKLVIVTTLPGEDISIERIEDSIRDTGYTAQNVKKIQ